MSETKTRGVGRSNNWATIVYPDSVSDNWIQKLDDMHLDVLISPIHDKDINPTGEEKKAHWHVLVKFDSVKTKEQAKIIFDEICGIGIERVSNFRNYARYLCHLDNPDKARYKEDDVIALGSIKYFDIISIPEDKYQIIGEIMDFCDINNVISYAQLLRICRKYKQSWFRALCDNASWVIKSYLKSKLWEINAPQSLLVNEKNIIDPETNEILK